MKGGRVVSRKNRLMGKYSSYKQDKREEETVKKQDIINNTEQENVIGSKHSKSIRDKVSYDRDIRTSQYLILFAGALERRTEQEKEMRIH